MDDEAQFTQAITIFDARQVKLADSRNTQFDPMNSDIRFEEGGHIEEEHSSKNNEQTSQLTKHEKMSQMMAKGGTVHGDGKKTNDAKDGGLFVGKSHDEGGIKAYNKDTNQPLEVEGKPKIKGIKIKIKGKQKDSYCIISNASFIIKSSYEYAGCIIRPLF